MIAIFAVGTVLVYLCQRLRLPPIVGFLLTGILIGPYALGLVRDIDLISSTAEVGDADPEVQWTMNFVLVEIGTHFPDHRERALAIGEKLGLYRDYPVSKGCISPFAPIAINEMVSRQG